MVWPLSTLDKKPSKTVKLLGKINMGQYIMSMLKRANQPERIDLVLKRTLKGLNIERRIKEETVVLNWNKVVGDRIARESIPVKVKDAILFVKVENASWRNELVFLKSNIIRGLNQSVGGSVIKEIVFTN